MIPTFKDLQDREESHRIQSIGALESMIENIKAGRARLQSISQDFKTIDCRSAADPFAVIEEPSTITIVIQAKRSMP